MFQNDIVSRFLQVVYDRMTGRSRGFGFVTMSSAEEVSAAVEQFNGYVSTLPSVSVHLYLGVLMYFNDCLLRKCRHFVGEVLLSIHCRLLIFHVVVM